MKNVIYEVWKVQNGVPVGDPYGDDWEEDGDTEIEDRAVEIKMGTFTSLDEAKLYEEALSHHIAKETNYVTYCFTPYTEIRVVVCDSVPLESYNEELEDIISRLRNAGSDVQKALLDGIRANLTLYDLVRKEKDIKQ